MNKKQIVTLIFSVYITFGNAQYDNAIPLTSKSQEAIVLFKKAQTLEGLLKVDDAELAYKSALVLDSTFAMAHLGLAMLKDDFERRKIHVRKAMNHIENVSEGEKLLIMGRNNFYGTQDGRSEYECFKELVKRYPEDDHANYLYGYVNIHHGRKIPDTAIYYYKKALKLNPNVSHYYNELAYAYMAKQDFKNAEAVIQQYIQFLPNHENPRDTYAELLMRDHRYEASFKAYDEVLKINPNAPWAYMGQAANLNFLNRFQEARAILQNLDSLPLSDYQYRHQWRSKVCSYITEGKLDSAIVVLEEQKAESTTGINEREPLFHQYMAYARITRLHFENNQPDEGLQNYNAWVAFVTLNLKRQTSIDNVLKLKNYYTAYSHYLKGNVQEAMDLIAKEVNASDDLKVLKARIYLSQKKPKQAIAILETLNGTNPYDLIWLSKAYLQDNNQVASHKIINRIKSLIEMNSIDYALALAIQKR